MAVPFGGLRALSLSKRLAPEPLPQPVGDEVVHLPKAAVVVGEGKVVAPATAHLVHFAHDLAGFFPGGVVPGPFAHPVPQGLFGGGALV